MRKSCDSAQRLVPSVPIHRPPLRTLIKILLNDVKSSVWVYAVNNNNNNNNCKWRMPWRADPSPWSPDGAVSNTSVCWQAGAHRTLYPPNFITFTAWRQFLPSHALAQAPVHFSSFSPSLTMSLFWSCGDTALLVHFHLLSPGQGLLR